jgi:adenine-specific DNA-methyltransferase
MRGPASALVVAGHKALDDATRATALVSSDGSDEMTAGQTAQNWAAEFGLALSPLFEAHESDTPGSHHVLLDGGHGSFALSISEEKIWTTREPASWTWSANLPHHVTVGERHVAVTRWDRTGAEVLSRHSVEAQRDAFYAYLSSDRVKSSQRVIEHVLGAFRRVRALLANARIEDAHTVDAFLAFLVRAVNRSGSGADWEPELDGEAILGSVPQSPLESLLDDFIIRSSALRGFTLQPTLAIRHAGAEIFQEAHFELIRAPAPDLFDYTGPAESRRITRGGAHFTPPALARSVVEQTFAQVPDLLSRREITIVDPACGSAAFLTEALRTLRRLGFDGKLSLVGRDVSPAAVAMAKFSLSAATRDWVPSGGRVIDIQVADSLSSALPAADIVLMNPPFVAWSALSSDQRDRMHALLGERLQGRGDYSMAFITRAMDNLKRGGAMGTLIPASLLTLRAADLWRKSLLDQAELRFLSSLGEYGLFAYATVQVAALIMRKQPPESERHEFVTALVTANNAEATGDALRVLRKVGDGSDLTGDEQSWSLFRVPAESLRQRSTWRLVSTRSETALRRAIDVGGAVRIGDLFDVRQGVRTGLNSVFLLNEEQIAELPKRERTWFRPAIINESIAGGAVKVSQSIFYPYRGAELAIDDEWDLAKKLPNYFQRFLLPNKERLQSRASIAPNREIWWTLSRQRGSWAADKRPRIVSKYFGGVGGFALDLDAEFVVVQGFAWLPKWVEVKSMDAEQAEDAIDSSNELIDSSRLALAAYVALMNSRRFERLLEIFAPHVAGGQFDLSPRYVNAVPVPNFPTLLADERAGNAIRKLAGMGMAPRVPEPDWLNVVDRLAHDLYGGELFDNI